MSLRDHQLVLAQQYALNYQFHNHYSIHNITRSTGLAFIPNTHFLLQLETFPLVLYLQSCSKPIIMNIRIDNNKNRSPDTMYTKNYEHQLDVLQRPRVLFQASRKKKDQQIARICPGAVRVSPYPPWVVLEIKSQSSNGGICPMDDTKKQKYDQCTCNKQQIRVG